MKLSEAIRLGAMLQPQGRVSMVSKDGRTCALGAARDAGYPITENLSTGHAVERYPDVVRCPACSTADGLYHVIAHLNDWHRWTRERIADWVEGVESARQQASEHAEAINAVAREDEEGKAVPFAHQGLP